MKFADFCAASRGHYDRVALVYDVRAGEPFDLLIATLERLKRTDVTCRLLFLDADTNAIINRYKETRRAHPLSAEGRSIEQAVMLERQMLQPVRDHADIVLDTSAFSVGKLRSELLNLFGRERDRQGLHRPGRGGAGLCVLLPQTGEFMAQLEKLLLFLLPQYNAEGKTVLVISVGCTGGHHRSVAVAHALAQSLSAAGFAVTESHRDISR